MTIEQRLSGLEAEVERLRAVQKEIVGGTMLTIAALIYSRAIDKEEFIRDLQGLLAADSERHEAFLETCLAAIIAAKAAMAAGR